MFTLNSTEINNQSFLQERLNISMIMTPKNELKVCDLNDDVNDLIKNNIENFTYLPVIDNKNSFIGVIDILNQSKITTTKKVKDYFYPI